jgi:hypothetical protein
VILASLLALQAHAGTITTVVGGSNGDGYPSDVTKSVPQHLVVDPNGNLIFGDTWDHRVRRVDAASEITTSIAGIGQFGYNGENIAATTAKLASPSGIARKSNGDVYVAEQLGHRVRRINAANGQITTVAGTGTGGWNNDGPGTTAQLNFPMGLSLSGNNLLIADSANHRIACSMPTDSWQRSPAPPWGTAVTAASPSPPSSVTRCTPSSTLRATSTSPTNRTAVSAASRRARFPARVSSPPSPVLKTWSRCLAPAAATAGRLPPPS